MNIAPLSNSLFFETDFNDSGLADYQQSSNNTIGTEAIEAGVIDNQQPLENEFGEAPLPYAPVVSVMNGRQVVPQQFLDVNRSLKSVEAVLSHMTVPKSFLLFAGQENGLVYLMCGVIGHENYIKRASQKDELKIVYGRRWFLEPSTPTSEVIQTATLAIKKAREHELRERVVVHIDCDQNSHRATPFNCHMDLPLMATQAQRFDGASTAWSVSEVLSRMRVDNLQPSLYATTELSGGRKVYDLNLELIGEPATTFNEFDNARVSLLCEQGTQSEFLHALFDALLNISDRHVDEVTTFENFARFSRSLCPIQIAQFSCQTRNIPQQDKRFGRHFQDMSYRVDAAKAPNINKGKLGDSQRDVLSLAEQNNGPLAGYLPHGYVGLASEE